MILNGIEFGRVWNASGARGFFGEGYWFHRPLRPFGLDWSGSTFVVKTTTLEPRVGNMPLDGIRPREWKPRCIRVNFRKGAVLNAVGLSGPGLDALLGDGRWQVRLDPFILSFMSVEADPKVRTWDAMHWVSRLYRERARFRAPFAIEVNLSCPNVGLDPDGLIREGRDLLKIFRDNLPGVPLLPKINALVPVDAARELADHYACDGLVVSNTIPWGRLPDCIDWAGLFGEVSPLAHLGGGGLSGVPLFRIVRNWLLDARRSNFPVPIVAGGGIMTVRDANVLFAVGAAAVELGSVAILRPWRVQGIIRRVNAGVPKERMVKA